MGRMNMLGEVVAVAVALVCCATGSALAEEVASQALMNENTSPVRNMGASAKESSARSL